MPSSETTPRVGQFQSSHVFYPRSSQLSGTSEPFCGKGLWFLIKRNCNPCQICEAPDVLLTVIAWKAPRPSLPGSHPALHSPAPPPPRPTVPRAGPPPSAPWGGRCSGCGWRCTGPASRRRGPWLRSRCPPSPPAWPGQPSDHRPPPSGAGAGATVRPPWAPSLSIVATALLASTVKPLLPRAAWCCGGPGGGGQGRDRAALTGRCRPAACLPGVA